MSLTALYVRRSTTSSSLLSIMVGARSSIIRRSIVTNSTVALGSSSGCEGTHAFPNLFSAVPSNTSSKIRRSHSLDSTTTMTTTTMTTNRPGLAGGSIRMFHATPHWCKKQERDDGEDDEYEEDAEEAPAKDVLLDMLERELAEEKMNESSDMPDNLEELKNKLSEDWKIVETGATIRMVRNNNNTDSSLNLKVQLSFHCQDVMDNDNESGNQGEEDEDEEEQEDQEEEAGSIRFTVIASKAGHTLVFSCLSDGEEVQIHTVSTTSSTNDDDGLSLLTNGAVPAQDYQGPEFGELADDLQMAFHEYLARELGITEDVAAFIAMYSDFKEQENYVKFLKQTKRILS